MPVSAPSSDTTAETLQWQKVDWKILFSLALLAMVFCLWGLGGFGILDPSDGYYAEVAREMVESGDFLTPHLNYVPWFDKPILCYWLIALSYKTFGVSEFAARLPSAIFGATMIPLGFAFCRQWIRRRSAILAALVLLSSPLWLMLAHLSLTDLTLSFFIWLATGCLISSLKRQSLPLLISGYAAAGLGMLTKGPLALFLIGMFVLVFLVISSASVVEFKGQLMKLRPFLGLFVFLLVAAPWYAAVSLTTHGAFFQEFFFNQNLNRALGAVDHKAGPIYYLPIFLGGFFPWCLIFLTEGLVLLRKRIPLKRREPRKFSINRQRNADSLGTQDACAPSAAPVRPGGEPSASASVLGSTNQRSQLAKFAAISGLLSLAFFTLLPSKLVTYILPCIPAFSIFAGMTLDKYMRCKSIRVLLLPTCILALLCLSGIGILLIKHPLNLPQAMMITICSYLGALTIVPLFALCRSPRWLGLALVAVTVGGVGILCPLALQSAYDLKCRDFQALVEVCKARNLNPIVVGRRLPSAIFYFRRRVNVADTIQDLVAAVDGSNSVSCLLANDGVVDSLRVTGHQVKVGEKRGEWNLILVKSLTLHE